MMSASHGDRVMIFSVGHERLVGTQLRYVVCNPIRLAQLRP